MIAPLKLSKMYSTLPESQQLGVFPFGAFRPIFGGEMAVSLPEGKSDDLRGLKLPVCT